MDIIESEAKQMAKVKKIAREVEIAITKGKEKGYEMRTDRFWSIFGGGHSILVNQESVRMEISSSSFMPHAVKFGRLLEERGYKVVIVELF